MKKQEIIISTTRLLIGLLGLAALIAQFHGTLTGGRSVVNFFSFFTIESSIFAVILYIALGIYGLAAKHPRPLSTLRGGITLYMTLTGIVYMLLLAGNEVSLLMTIPWVNVVLHYLLPAIILLDWLFFPPKNFVPARRIALWLIFPAVYLTYTLIRGSFTGWYPYPFLDPVVNGWPTVAVTIILIAVGTILGGWLLSLRTKSYLPKVSM